MAAVSRAEPATAMTGPNIPNIHSTLPMTQLAIASLDHSLGSPISPTNPPVGPVPLFNI